MQKISYLVFELGTYILILYCVRHAWKRKRQAVLALLSGVVYGVLLEYAAIQAYQAHEYGQFLVMIGDKVPLCIGAMWSVILYAAMQTVERVELPAFLQLGFTSLLALSIDFSLDAIAIRLGFWTWFPSNRITLWGVPLFNYYTWILVAASFWVASKLGLWLLRSRRWGLVGDCIMAILVPPLAVIFLFVLFFVHGPLIDLFDQRDPFTVFLPVVVGGFVLGILAFVWRSRWDNTIDLGVLTVPIFFHAFCLLTLFMGNYYTQEPSLIGLCTVTLMVSMTLFTWPHWAKFFIRRDR